MMTIILLLHIIYMELFLYRHKCQMSKLKCLKSVLFQIVTMFRTLLLRSFLIDWNMNHIY